MALDPTAVLFRESAGADLALLEQAERIRRQIADQDGHGGCVEVFRGSAPVTAQYADAARADPMLQAGRQLQMIDDLRKIGAEMIGHVYEAQPVLAGRQW